MTTQVADKEQPNTKPKGEVSFKCRYCGKNRPLNEMRTLTRFFPPVVTCRECARKMD